ncbi:MAG: FtsQ-type POTRA domain-containing protein [Myxococcales bacterium]|nr:FtsQ-type POTRA domain-containing protein [Myxococcales bacterium]
MSAHAVKKPQRRPQRRKQSRRPQPGEGLRALLPGARASRPSGVRQNRRRQGQNRRRVEIASAPQAAPRRLGPLARRTGSFLGRFALAGALAWALLLGIQQGYAFVTTSPRFAADTLLFTPTPHLSPERVAELMGIEEGTNILALDLPELEQRIAGDRWVKSVEVRRELPDSLRVAIVEHEAAAVLLADRFYLVDRSGRPFKQLGHGERGDLPIITGVDRRTLDEREVQARAMTRRALEVMDVYRQDGAARPAIGEIHIGETGELSVFTAATRTELRLGRDAFADKLARYDALRDALGDQAERLAVVHLDAIGGGDRSERIVASFLTPEDEVAALSRGSAARSGAAASRDSTEGETDTKGAHGPAKGAKKGASKGAQASKKGPKAGADHASATPGPRKKTRRIPRYE